VREAEGEAARGVISMYLFWGGEMGGDYYLTL